MVLLKLIKFPFLGINPEFNDEYLKLFLTNIPTLPPDEFNIEFDAVEELVILYSFKTYSKSML